VSHWGRASDLLDDFKRGEVDETQTIELLGVIDPWFFRNKIAEANREAAFWKWMWESGEAPTREPSIGHWLAHMRERWEREAS
jgi:hypothetical protein